MPVRVDDPKSMLFRRSTTVIERCLLMTTDPGDLVLDPTCGSGTTAYVAEQWGRRWITADVSRVPLALARQRLLTATFDWYELKDDARGPAGGFVYKRKQNKKGEEVGGIVPHVTLKSIANNEPPAEEVLVDRPEINSERHARDRAVLRGGDDPDAGGLGGKEASALALSQAAKGRGSPDRRRERGPGAQGRRERGLRFAERMLEMLRKSPVLRLGGRTRRSRSRTFARRPRRSRSRPRRWLTAMATGQASPRTR